MKIELKPAIEATLYLVLIVGFMALVIFSPKRVLAALFALFLSLWLGSLWWFLYAIARDRARLKKPIERSDPPD
jgi:hypothetical protein